MTPPDIEAMVDHLVDAATEYGYTDGGYDGEYVLAVTAASDALLAAFEHLQDLLSEAMELLHADTADKPMPAREWANRRAALVKAVNEQLGEPSDPNTTIR